MTEFKGISSYTFGSRKEIKCVKEWIDEQVKDGCTHIEYVAQYDNNGMNYSYLQSLKERTAQEWLQDEIVRAEKYINTLKANLNK